MIIARRKPIQTLEEHVRDCVRAFEILKEKKFWKLFGKNFEKELQIAIVLHDSGKIFYQTKENFLGHELFSAFISHVFIDFLEFDSKLVEATILYHHYAMGIKERIAKFKFREFKVCEKLEEFDKILEEHGRIVLKYVDLEKSVAREAIERVNEAIQNRLEGCKLEYGGILETIKGENSEIWRRFVEEREFRKSMLFCINMMTLVDYAGVPDTGEKKGFGRIVEDFFRVYAPLGRL
ncbi:MAG: hypothetical protein ACK401_01395 [Archaeoglobaceae archaeon]